MSTLSLPNTILLGLATEIATEESPKDIELSYADVRAFEQTLWLAERIGAKLRLLHVVDHEDDRFEQGNPDLDAKVYLALKPRLEKMDREAAARGVNLTYRLTQGRPWYELLRIAHEEGLELVVTTPRSQQVSFKERLKYGSTSKALIRNASTPVWVVDPDRKVGIESILALVDGTPMSERVVAQALLLSESLGAERLILRCADRPVEVVLQRAKASEPAEATSVAKEGELRERMLAQLRALTGGEEAGWKLFVSDDWIADEASRLASEQDVDLIVMGTISESRLKGLLLGTSVERVLEKARVGVWLVHPEGWQSPLKFDGSDEL